jgi:DNA-directed RNA polymerase subunit RPC12/RpoP
MLICESCGAVFEYPATKMEQDTGWIEESCPECGSRYIMKAAKCKRCEEWVSEDSAFGYGGNVICEDCLQEANGARLHRLACPRTNAAHERGSPTVARSPASFLPNA